MYYLNLKKKHNPEHFCAIRTDGLETIKGALQNLGVIKDHQFIIHFLEPAKQVDPLDEQEWKAVDCNHRVVAMLELGITKYLNALVVQPMVGNEKLSWDILDLIAASENYLHDQASVQSTPWDQLFRIMRIRKSFLRGAEQKQTNWEALVSYLVF